VEVCAVIEVDSLSFEYPGVLALDNVSLSIEKGSIAALVGPNGAGKTTLLRCMAALEHPIAGTVKIGGVDAHEDPRVCHKKIGYLRDIFGLYDDLSVERCITYAAASHGIADAALPEAVKKAAARLRIDNHLLAKAGVLSRGLRQRVAIAQAVVHEPAVLILDEPASGLDPEARHTLSGLFLELSGQGMTLIVSSHILTELEEYSTHMIILDKGRVVSSSGVSGKAVGDEGAYFTVELIAPHAALENFLLSVDGVSNVSVKPGGAVFMLRGDASTQAELLKRLVGQGFGVKGFYETRENMHESYLKKIKETRGGA